MQIISIKNRYLKLQGFLSFDTINHTLAYKLLVLDRNTWNYMIVCKLLISRIVTWSYDFLITMTKTLETIQLCPNKS